VNGFAFRRRLQQGSPSMGRQQHGPDGGSTPGPESLQDLERVLVAARFGDAARLRAAQHCGVEDLLSVGGRATRPWSPAGHDPQP
jgi:hypothetical protein